MTSFTCHFQIFFRTFDLNLKKNPVNQVIKQFWPNYSLLLGDMHERLFAFLR